jgi:hypothetical protein
MRIAVQAALITALLVCSAGASLGASNVFSERGNMTKCNRDGKFCAAEFSPPKDADNVITLLSCLIDRPKDDEGKMVPMRVALEISSRSADTIEFPVPFQNTEDGLSIVYQADLVYLPRGTGLRIAATLFGRKGFPNKSAGFCSITVKSEQPN